VPQVSAAISELPERRSQRALARLMAPKLRALADENRLTLLLIAEHPRTVKELQVATGLSQTLVSHHLTPLREQELVSVVPEGRSNRYTLCCSALDEPVRLLLGLARRDDDAASQG
jgi:DNA-binding transcriptional ArsR family regulator